MCRARVVAATVIALASGCDAEGPSLAVDLKTDLVPGVEFTAVRTEIFRGLPAPGSAPAAQRDAPAPAILPFLAGSRVAEIADPPSGDVTVRVSLRDTRDRIVAERLSRVQLDRTTVVTVVITRDCRGRSCPGPGDDPLAITCAGGRCVDPRCRMGSEESCAAPECDSDATCPAMAACARAACVEGVCLYSAASGGCAADEYCAPEIGCRPVASTETDAGRADGGGDDAGASDAGPRDAGPPDAGARDSGIPPPGCIPIRAAPIDTAVRPELPLAWPPAGGSFRDPVFGTEIVRLTDSGDARVISSERSAFNSESTRLTIRHGSEMVLYDFDAATGAATRVRALTAAFIPETPCFAPDAVWSRTDPDVLYCASTESGAAGKVVVAYDVTAPDATSRTMVADLTPLLGPGQRLTAMRLSDDQDVIGVGTTNRGDTGIIDAAVHRRSDGMQRALGLAMASDFVAADLDPTGRYLLVRDATGPWMVWDWEADVRTPVPADATTHAGACEQAAGPVILGLDCTRPALVRRTYAAPHVFTDVLVHGAAHEIDLSMEHRSPAPFAVVTTHSTSVADLATWDPFEQEIAAVALDGSFVARLAHHRTTPDGPLSDADAPTASISYDGRWIVFTSRHSGSATDVFALRVPPRCP